MNNKMCTPTNKFKNWKTIPWQKVIKFVTDFQRRIAKATQHKKWGKVKALSYMLTHSYYAKLLAVKRVVTNKGGKTAGVDKQTWHTPNQRLKAASTLTAKGYKPKPLKRVYIPKKNGKYRPLSIPPIYDRAMQALYTMPLQAISETTGDLNSYGFRIKRCCQDAIAQCFKVLVQKYSPCYVLEGDISACFDNISQTWMLDNIPVNKTILKKWFGCGYIENKKLFNMSKGTPQGGVISPFLMNLTLDGLEQLIRKDFPAWKRSKVNFVRYADDFIITAPTKEILSHSIIPLVKEFLAQRGLTLSDEKTKITHIDTGFTFLSQNIRKYNGKLLIRPAKEAIENFMDKIRQTLKKNRGIPAHALIRIINPIIRGWSNYHKSICAKKTFSKLGHFIYQQLYNWARKENGGKSGGWIYKRFFSRRGFFSDTKLTTKGIKVHTVYRIAYVPIVYHTKIKSEANPFLAEFDSYFAQRKEKIQSIALKCKDNTAYLVENKTNKSRVSLS